jgi:hypothetical protein
MPRDDLRKQTWLWDPALGGFEMKEEPQELKYELPKSIKESNLKGLQPY